MLLPASQVLKILTELRAPPQHTKLPLRNVNPKVQSGGAPQSWLTLSSVCSTNHPDHILFPPQPENPLPPQNTPQEAKVTIRLWRLQEHLVY